MFFAVRAWTVDFFMDMDRFF